MNNEKFSGRDKMSKTVVILYIVAALMGIIFIYMFIEAAAYISDYMDSYGMSMGDMWADAIQYILSSSLSYIVFGLLLYAAGRILDVLQRGRAAGNENITEEVSINLIEGKSEEKTDEKSDKDSSEQEDEDAQDEASKSDEEDKKDE